MMRVFICLMMLCATVVATRGQQTGMGKEITRLKELMKKMGEVVAPNRDSLPFEVYVLRGKVMDADTKNPIEGASVLIYSDSLHRRGIATDPWGNFRFEGLKLGRYKVEVTHLGYNPVAMTEQLNAAHQLVLIVPLEVSVMVLDTVLVKQKIIDPVGSRAIDRSGTGNPGSRGEAVRKVAVLPGIIHSDDSRNDVVIRGNSPGSVVWRLEGVNIPNPNHFNIPGTSGGPVSIINDRMLGASAFYSGAFPSEFGNTTSGLFDLTFRNGNDSQFESHIQFGLLGAELSGEGPLSRKKKSSFLFSMRRSTLGLLQKLPIDIGTESTPRYTDVAYKLHFPGRNNAELSFFGLGGLSEIDILISQGVKNFYGEKDRDQYFRSGSGVGGIHYKLPSKNSTASVSVTLAASAEKTGAYHHLVNPPDLAMLLNGNGDASQPYILRYDFKERRISGMVKMNKKMKRQGSIFTAGVTSDLYFFRYLDSARNTDYTDKNFNTWRVRWKTRETGWLLQPYLQWRSVTGNSKLEYVLGLHSQYFSVSDSYSPWEPRVALKYFTLLHHNHNFNFGFGLHSQVQAPYLYFFGSSNDSRGNPVAHHNRQMDFTRSRHVVMGYEHFFGNEDDRSAPIRLKAEVYHQYIYNVPVEIRPTSFSFLNTGSTFTRFYKDSLVNEGRGENYGVEITIDKSFSKGYLFLVTASLFESKYNGSDQIWRDTDLNGNYIVNALGTREWSFGSRKVKDVNANVLSLGTRFSLAGGRRYGPIDVDASHKRQEVVYVDATHNVWQFRPYFRWDIRFSYKWNYSNRVTHEFTVDIINILNVKNILRKSYRPGPDRFSQPVFQDEYQLGLLPFFYYRWSF
jgi:hypothetical protein